MRVYAESGFPLPVLPTATAPDSNVVVAVILVVGLFLVLVVIVVIIFMVVNRVVLSFIFCGQRLRFWFLDLVSYETIWFLVYSKI